MFHDKECVFSQVRIFLCTKPNRNVLFKDEVFLSVITVKKTLFFFYFSHERKVLSLMEFFFSAE